jgi:phosphatidylglycerol---prolipoprotein diacylglyceryl transferase
MVVLAVIAVILLALQEAKRLRIPQEDIYNIAIWAIVGGIIFARLFHVVDRWDYYIQNPSQIFTNFEGVAIYGAVFGVVLAFVVYSLVKKLSIWKVADAIAPGALVGMAIGRVGCLLNGCCYGLDSDAFCSITYTNSFSYGPVGTSVLPTQLFHIIWNMVAFGFIWAFRKKFKPAGTTFLLYLAIYAAGDLTIRFFREGTPFLFGMQEAQVIGILILVITIPLMLYRIFKARGKPEVTEEEAAPEPAPEQETKTQ